MTNRVALAILLLAFGGAEADFAIEDVAQHGVDEGVELRQLRMAVDNEEVKAEEADAESESVQAAYCAAKCKAAGYCCNDWTKGSNQMISCSQACMMRASGSHTKELAASTGGICKRTGGSGCSLTVKGKSYGFCSSCKDLTSSSKCSFGVANSAACDHGAGLTPPGAPSQAYCKNGVKGYAKGGVPVCCPASCGVCGGKGCNKRSGGGACCTGNHLKADIKCANSGAVGCLIPKSLVQVDNEEVQDATAEEMDTEEEEEEAEEAEAESESVQAAYCAAKCKAAG